MPSRGRSNGLAISELGNDEILVSRFIFAGEAGQCESIPLPVSIPGTMNLPASPGFIHPSAHIEEKAGPVSAFDSHGRDGHSNFAGLVTPGHAVFSGRNGGQFRFQLLEPVLRSPKGDALAPVL